MAKLTRSNSIAASNCVTALVDAVPTFAAGTGRFTIGLTSGETGLTYHLHLSEAEASVCGVRDRARQGLRVGCLLG
jgi:hypothetical protein